LVTLKQTLMSKYEKDIERILIFTLIPQGAGAALELRMHVECKPTSKGLNREFFSRSDLGGRSNSNRCGLIFERSI
jgi:hypothetical protein